jgi:uncharacterized protein YaaN involved in tellurite resistance
VSSTEPLALTPPQPVGTVAGDQAQSAVEVPAERTVELDAMAAAYVEQLAALDARGAEFQEKLRAVHQLGSAEIKEAASVSNRLLDKPVRALRSGPLDKGSTVSSSLVELRRTVEDLDPRRQGGLARRKLLGLVPVGGKLRDYFGRYQSSQTHIQAILEALYGGQDELRKDNASIEQEKVNLWATMQRLREYVYLARTLDSALDAHIAAVERTDVERAKALKGDVQFYVRQKVEDLLTQLAVSVQGYLALEMIRKNNLELIKGVDRATTTTVSALRTAVIVAQALADQKLVLDQIAALNTTTSSLIESTSVMLREQSGQVHEQAASSTIDLDQLRQAFDNIYATMDTIDAYRLEALTTMRQTADALSGEVDRARSYLDRATGAPGNPSATAGAPAVELTLPAAIPERTGAAAVGEAAAEPHEG